jgi:uncharacterized protein involved in exopolysaccharide biosynthesis
MQGVLSVPQPGTSPSTAAIILTSRTNTIKLISAFNLDELWRRSMDMSIERFNKRFRCTVGESGDLRIAFTDPSPTRAEAVVQKAVNLLTDSVEELSLDPAARNAAFLRRNLAQAEETTAKAQKALVTFQQAVGGEPPSDQLQTMSRMSATIREELLATETQASTALARVRTGAKVGAEMLKRAQDPLNNKDALVTTLYQDVVRKETEVARLRETYTDKRPEVVKATQDLEASRKSLRKEIDRQLASLADESSPYLQDAVVEAMAARARIDGLRKAQREITQRLSALPELDARFAELSMNLQHERNRLTVIRGEYVKAQLIAESRGPQFVVLDPPSQPRKPNQYPTYYFTIFGALLGLVLTVFEGIGLMLKGFFRNLGF